MSVRIYQLSKEIGMENKDLLALLRKRGYEVASASSTISNIDAEALVTELKPSEEAEAEKPAEADSEAAAEPVEEEPALPAGRFVKSADEVALEKAPPKPEAKQAAPKTSAPPSAPPAPPPTPPVVKTAAKAPPSTPPVAPAKSPPSPVAPVAAAGAPPAAGTPPSASAPPSTPPSTPPTPGAPPAAPTTEADAGETAAAAGDDAKILSLKPPIVVRDFAEQIGLKPFRLISELMEMGIFASMNQSIEEDTAAKVAEKHGFLLEVRHRGKEQEAPKKKEQPKVDESALLEPRPPVVCVMGHVDHGKTTLLDAIRKTEVVAGEAGGITQHVGAYQVSHNDHKITFIDTPGHAAFSRMRERGAKITDVAVLVIAADDGFKPQTEEALKFAQKSNVPPVIAINKIDTKGANIDKVKKQLQDRGIPTEDWGGETLFAEMSAVKGEGVESLLEALLLQAEILELKANPKGAAEGTIIESQVEVGRGPTATLIVTKGTLKTGDALVCGTTYCKVRALLDDHGKKLKSAGPSTPVRILGWSDAPESGATARVVKNERQAKSEAEEEDRRRKSEADGNAEAKPASLESLMAAIDQSQQACLRVIIRGDVHGTVEALRSSLEEIKSDKVRMEIISAGVGTISQKDVTLASTSGATIVGFNVKNDNGVIAQAKHEDVRIIHHNIIYELIDQVKEAMAELLEPELEEHKLGAAEVRAVFPISKGKVAGCMVTEGKITRDAHARLYRDGEVVYEGGVGTLRRFKEDVGEVKAGYECGIRLGSNNDYREGDTIECFEIIKIQPTL